MTFKDAFAGIYKSTIGSFFSRDEYRNEGEVVEFAHNHDADGGLELLKHLGLVVAEKEKAAFVRLWDAAYAHNGRHFLSTACELYGALPFAIDMSDIDRDVKKEREQVYTGKIRSTELEPWMTE